MTDNSALRHAAAALMLIALAVTAWGLIESGLWQTHYWSDWALLRWMVIVPGFVLLGTLLARRHRGGLLALTGAIVLLWSIQYSGLGAVASVLWILASCWLLGDRLMPEAIPEQIDATRVLLAVLLGLCLFVLLFQAMFLLPINRPWVYAALTALPWLRLARRNDPISRRVPALWQAMRRALSQQGRTPWSHSLLLAIGLLPVVFLTLIANRPESGHDALGLHLWIPEYVARHGFWHFDVSRSIWSVFPMSANVSFTWAYLLGGEMAARLINFSFILLTGGVLFAVCRSRLDAPRNLLLVGCFLSLPLIALEASTLFVDLQWMLLLFAAIVMTRIDALSFQRRWLLVTLLFSLAMTSKIMAVFVAPLLVVIYLWQRLSLARSDRQRLGWGHLVGIVAILTVAGGWPFWIALIQTGNPVFPVMNHIFQSPYFPSGEGFSNPQYRDGFSGWRFIFDLTFESGRYLEGRVGSFGILWSVLLLPAIGVALWRRRALSLTALVASLLLILGIMPEQAYLRYLLPALPLMGLLFAELVALLQPHPGYRAAVSGLLVGIIGAQLLWFNAAAWQLSDLMVIDPQEHLARKAPSRVLNQLLNLTEPGARAYSLESFVPVGLHADMRSNSWYFPDDHRRSSRRGELLKILQETNTHFVIGRRTYVDGRPALAEFVRDHLIIQHEHQEWFLGKVRSELMFDESVIENPALDGDLAPWRSSLPVKRDGDLEVITRPHNLYQSFRVSAGDRFEVRYTISCPEPTQMRLELSWGSRAAGYLGNGMDIVECLGESQRYVREFSAPRGSEYGNVHVQPFGEETILVHQITVTR